MVYVYGTRMTKEGDRSWMWYSVCGGRDAGSGRGVMSRDREKGEVKEKKRWSRKV